MITPCYHCEKRTIRCHTSCEAYTESLKKLQEQKENQKRTCNSIHITERYELDRAFKIKKHTRNRRMK